ncbi:MAG: hypothetical protein ABIW47_05255, partial [Ginsengibacter sp.]
EDANIGTAGKEFRFASSKNLQAFEGWLRGVAKPWSVWVRRESFVLRKKHFSSGQTLNDFALL